MRRIFLLNIAFYLSCNAVHKKSDAVDSPKGYHLDQGVKLKLGQNLDEISGIVYYEPTHSIAAVDDEEAKIYSIDLDSNSKYKSWKFAKGGDFEDLTFTGTDWFALRSNGVLFKIKNVFTDSTTSEKIPFPADTRNEFESLYWDGKQLVMICKTCANDDANRVSAYGFNPATNTFPKEPLFVLDIDVSKKQESKKPDKLRPSAAAINPVTKDLFIIASQNRLLVIADTAGKIKGIFPLNGKVFKQPEGLCFTPNGDLYVSNEAKGGTANILKFSYQPGN